MEHDPIVIVGAARTPIGGLQGDFASLAASDLGGVAIRAAVERARVKPGEVDEVIFGNCLLAGQGQAPARQAALKGGLPLSTHCTTLSKMCGSAMKATMLAHDAVNPNAPDPSAQSSVGALMYMQNGKRYCHGGTECHHRLLRLRERTDSVWRCHAHLRSERQSHQRRQEAAHGRRRARGPRAVGRRLKRWLSR